MNAWKNHRMSFLLASGSLLLLLLFQIFWLSNIFNTEKDNIRERADQAFEEAVRNIEDSLVHILLFDKIDLDSYLAKIDDDNITVNAQSENETVQSIQKEIKVTEGDTLFNIKLDMRSNFFESNGKKEFGSMALWMAMDTVQRVEFKGDTSYLVQRDSSKDSFSPNPNPDLLKEKLIASVARADLPYPSEIKTIEKSEAPKGQLHSNIHKDIFSGKSYTLFFPNYRNFIFGKMLPQILFSIFLFGAIGFSFFLVWQSLAKQRRLTELKNDFISNVTHELKTPITTVGVALEALSNFNALKNPERTEEYINISKHELQRLSLLVDKVLKMSLFEKKEPELKLEFFDMQELVKGVLRSMKLQFEKSSANVNIEFEGSDFSIKGDKIHLTNVVYNLIDNALKYSKENPVITLLLKKENNQLQLQVQDQGIGISQNLKNKVFEKFFRVPQGDQHDVKGYGLGLSYVASVIKKHEGNISVDSELQKGTLFTISLPINYG